MLHISDDKKNTNIVQMNEEEGNCLFQNICNNDMCLYERKSLIKPDRNHNDGITPYIVQSSNSNACQFDVGGTMCDGCQKLLSFFNNNAIIFEIDKYHCNVCNYTDLCEDCYKEGIKPIRGPNSLTCQTQCKCEFVKTKYPELNKIPAEFMV
jgi:hypothetical protein